MPDTQIEVHEITDLFCSHVLVSQSDGSRVPSLRQVGTGLFCRSSDPSEKAERLPLKRADEITKGFPLFSAWVARSGS
jgi:hypothetical protein